MRHEKQVVFLDAGNVLVHYDLEKACRGLAELGGCTPNEVYFRYGKIEWVQRLETGQLSSHEFFEEVREGLRFPEHVTFTDFVERFSNIFHAPDDAVLHALRSLRKHVQLFIASNTQEMHWTYIRHVPTVKAIPEKRCVRSYDPDIRSRKPSAQFFQRALRRAKVEAWHVLYVDDMRENLATFEAMGGHVAHFDLTKHSPERFGQILRDHKLTVPEYA